MSLVAVTVRRAKKKGFNAKNESSATYALGSENVLMAIPSLCKTDAGTDGLVNSHVIAKIDGETWDLWVSQTATEIAALDS